DEPAPIPEAAPSSGGAAIDARRGVGRGHGGVPGGLRERVAIQSGGPAALRRAAANRRGGPPGGAHCPARGLRERRVRPRLRRIVTWLSPGTAIRWVRRRGVGPRG